MARQQKKQTSKLATTPRAEGKAASKQNALVWAIRIILAVLLLAVPIYLHQSRSETRIEFVLNTTHLGLQMDYGETERRLSREIQILNNSLDTKYLHSSYFQPFVLATKSTHNKMNLEYQILPLVNDRAGVTFTTEKSAFSIVSLTYKGPTQLEISGDASLCTFDFRPMPGVQDLWNVYAEISLPDTFNFIPEECSVRSVTPGEPALVSDGNQKLRLLSTVADPNIALANSVDQFKLKIGGNRPANVQILQNLEIRGFHMLRFDPRERKESTTLVDGHYRILSRANVDVYQLPANCTLEFVADRLILEDLKLMDNFLSSKFVGTFSSFKVCQLGNCNEAIPSKLEMLGNSPWVWLLSILYFTLLTGVAFGDKFAIMVSEKLSSQ